MEFTTYSEFKSAEPYFSLVRQALGDHVEGEHFFDIVTDETLYEVLYDLGWPRAIKGRNDLMEAFRGYCAAIELQAANQLRVHVADNGRTMVIEYEVQGKILETGAKYENRFCSIITISNQKIAHWRDYMDSLAAWKAITAPGHVGGQR